MKWSFDMRGSSVGTENFKHVARGVRGLAFLLFACLITGCAGKGSEVPNHAINPLQSTNKLFLTLAERMEAHATDDAELARALKRKAASLDTLGHSQAALETIDRALALTPETDQKELLFTKASILFSLDRALDSLAILVPMLELERSAPPRQALITEGDLSQEHIVAAFCYMRLEQWPDAVRALSRIQPSGPEDDLAAYAALTYVFINATTSEPVFDEWLDAQTEFSAANHTGHYGALIRMWRGHFDSREIASSLKELKATEQQEAFGEALFHRMAYTMYVEQNPEGAMTFFDRLNQLAPYGSMEWIYAKQALAAIQ